MKEMYIIYHMFLNKDKKWLLPFATPCYLFQRKSHCWIRCHKQGTTTELFKQTFYRLIAFRLVREPEMYSKQYFAFEKFSFVFWHTSLMSMVKWLSVFTNFIGFVWYIACILRFCLIHCLHLPANCEVQNYVSVFVGWEREQCIQLERPWEKCD